MPETLLYATENCLKVLEWLIATTTVFGGVRTFISPCWKPQDAQVHVLVPELKAMHRTKLFCSPILPYVSLSQLSKYERHSLLWEAVILIPASLKNTGHGDPFHCDFKPCCAGMLELGMVRYSRKGDA